MVFPLIKGYGGFCRKTAWLKVSPLPASLLGAREANTRGGGPPRSRDNRDRDLGRGESVGAWRSTEATACPLVSWGDGCGLWGPLLGRLPGHFTVTGAGAGGSQ